MNYRRKVRLKINMLGSDLQFMPTVALLNHSTWFNVRRRQLTALKQLLYLPSLKH